MTYYHLPIHDLKRDAITNQRHQHRIFYSDNYCIEVRVFLIMGRSN